MAGIGKHDLPLMANTKDVLVYHYILDLECIYNSKVIKGSITLFLDPYKQHKSEPSYQSVFSTLDYHKRAQQKVHSENNVTDESSCVNHVDCFEEKTVQGNCANSDKERSNATFHNIDVENENQLLGGIDVKNHQTISGGELFELILDACDLDVSCVEELHLPPQLERDLVESRTSDLRTSRSTYLACSTLTTSTDLEYSVDEWSVKIKKLGVTRAKDFPHVVRILYQTKPEGKSLRWATDQDKR